MKTLKQTDLWVQAVLISGGFVYVLLATGGQGPVFHVFFAIGAWQLPGYGLHYCSVNNLFFRHERRQYGLTILCLLATGIICFGLSRPGLPLFLFFRFGMLMIVPLLAGWYFSICLRELRLMNQKELIHLK